MTSEPGSGRFHVGADARHAESKAHFVWHGEEILPIRRRSPRCSGGTILRDSPGLWLADAGVLAAQDLGLASIVLDASARWRHYAINKAGYDLVVMRQSARAGDCAVPPGAGCVAVTPGLGVGQRKSWSLSFCSGARCGRSARLRSSPWRVPRRWRCAAAIGSAGIMAGPIAGRSRQN